MESKWVCRALSISPRTLQYYKASGKLPFSFIGNKTYFRWEDVQALLEKRLQNPKPKKDATSQR